MAEQDGTLVFDDGVAYKRGEIKRRLYGVSDRVLDALLKNVPRVELTRRTILYLGAELNRMVAARTRKRVS